MLKGSILDKTQVICYKFKLLYDDNSKISIESMILYTEKKAILQEKVNISKVTIDNFQVYAIIECLRSESD